MKKRVFIILLTLITLLLTSLAFAINAKVFMFDNLRDASFNLGKSYFEKGEYNSAIEQWKITIEEDNNYKEAYYNIGVAYYTISEYNKAIVSFQKAIELDPEYIQAYYSLGLLYYKIKDYEKAIFNLKNIINIDPKNTNALFDLGIIYAEIFRNQENKGVIYHEDLENLKQAKNYYLKVLELDLDFPNAKNNLEIITKILDDYLSNFNNL